MEVESAINKYEARPAVAFDLEAYVSAYTGHSRADRLLYIVEHSKGKELELEALKIAHNDVKKTENTPRYDHIVKMIDGRLGDDYKLDSAWVEAVDRKCLARQEKLEQELTGSKTNLIKESIRMGHNDLGDLLYERGDLQGAFKCFVRSRDYCTTSRHVVSMCLSSIRVAVEMANWMHVQNYVAKAEQSPDVGTDPVVMGKIRAAAGLSFLQTKKYKQAAKKFVEVNPELGTSYNDVLAPQDVAVYGGLCALATFNRTELQSQVITNIGFKEFIELVPELRDTIRDFYHSRYAACLRALEVLRPSLTLDLHLGAHVTSLYDQIRERAVMQYVSPFMSVDLNAMAVAFNTSVGALEKEVAGLIMDSKVQARIDSHRKILFARHADVRGQTYAHVLNEGEAYLRESKAMLLRANLLQHDLIQRPPRTGGGGRKGEVALNLGGVMEKPGSMMRMPGWIDS
ncbi:hypothetical protein CEUSTIGMA_g6105.t1 [Chlamydomonas eustigma]|uniref:PCI domain-containing protein n=1 Tax=Chlamydomonas eustigma TaxID=1157962 RepID=A0A250X6H3_9CHLO|nr:hypothetical protein CEUSTIGMA_g6105.t1 [Chlamydomonas eustigma]|eukprot:GAX78667.1 hypothetical protein CEUSTIGMA_g6105.t1 [Chlamydomonas eustigma]